MYLFQTFADQLKGFTKTFFQGVVQLFIHRFAHFLQFFLVFGLDGRQFFFDLGPEMIKFLFVHPGQIIQLFGKAVQEIFCCDADSRSVDKVALVNVVKDCCNSLRFSSEDVFHS